MGHSDKVLDTVNRTIKYYRDENTKKKEFINMSLLEIAAGFVNSWIYIIRDIISIQDSSEFAKILTKDERIFYVGIMLVVVSILFFLIEISG